MLEWEPFWLSICFLWSSPKRMSPKCRWPSHQSWFFCGQSRNRLLGKPMHSRTSQMWLCWTIASKYSRIDQPFVKSFLSVFMLWWHFDFYQLNLFFIITLLLTKWNIKVECQIVMTAGAWNGNNININYVFIFIDFRINIWFTLTRPSMPSVMLHVKQHVRPKLHSYVDRILLEVKVVPGLRNVYW